MGKRLDLLGQVFGRLTVIGDAGNKNRISMWLCRCECNTEKVVTRRDLQTGDTKSCGCLNIESAGERLRTHGSTGSPEHRAWKHIRQRCLNPRNKSAKYYSERGISVSPTWDSFTQFLEDMGPRPSDKHSIDRIDNDGNYCKENCRWATAVEQSQNRRSNVHLTLLGETMSAADWSRSLGAPSNAVANRLNRGMSIESALTTPYKPREPK